MKARRRVSIGGAVAAAVIGGFLQSEAAAPPAVPLTPPQITAATLIGRLGVQAPIAYTDGKYVRVDDVVDKLNYIGVRKIRAHNLDPTYDRTGQVNYLRAALAGIEFNLVINGNLPLTQTMERIEAFERSCPGAVVAIEGPNEIVHAPVRYKGLSGDAAAAALQVDLFAAVRASSRLTGVKVLSYSLDQDSRPSGGYDAAALHPYPQNGDQPRRWLENASRLAPAGARRAITETGYATLPSWWMGVDEETQAKLTLNAIFDAALLGIEDVYLYELLDAYPDPDWKEGGRHYGLFRLDGKPKPAAVALRNLTQILSDSTVPNAVQPPLPEFFLAEGPSDLSTLVVTKRDGRRYIALWREPDIWDQNAHRSLSPPDTRVSIEFARPVPYVRVFDPVRSAAAISNSENAGRVSLQLSAQVMLIELSSSAVRTASRAAPAPRPCTAAKARARTAD